MVRLTKLLRGLDGFADDKWVCVRPDLRHRVLARLLARPGRVVPRPCRRQSLQQSHPNISPLALSPGYPGKGWAKRCGAQGAQGFTVHGASGAGWACTVLGVHRPAALATPGERAHEEQLVAKDLPMEATALQRSDAQSQSAIAGTFALWASFLACACLGWTRKQSAARHEYEC